APIFSESVLMFSLTSSRKLMVFPLDFNRHMVHRAAAVVTTAGFFLCLVAVAIAENTIPEGFLFLNDRAVARHIDRLFDRLGHQLVLGRLGLGAVMFGPGHALGIGFLAEQGASSR